MFAAGLEILFNKIKEELETIKKSLDTNKDGILDEKDNIELELPEEDK